MIKKVIGVLFLLLITSQANAYTLRWKQEPESLYYIFIGKDLYVKCFCNQIKIPKVDFCVQIVEESMIHTGEYNQEGKPVIKWKVTGYSRACSA